MFDFFRNLGKSKEEKRQEAISGYLDGFLTPGERQRFEEQLVADPILREEVEQQLFIQENIQHLPQVRAPRNFTLDPALYGTPESDSAVRIYPVLRTATVLVGIFFVISVGATLFFPQASRMESMAQAPMVEEIGDISRSITIESEQGFMGAPAEEAAAPRIVTETLIEKEEIASEAEMVAEEAAEEAPAPAEEPVMEPPSADAESEFAADEAAAEEAVPQEAVPEGEVAEAEPGLGAAAPITEEDRQMTEEATAADMAAAEAASETPMFEAPAVEAPTGEPPPTASPATISTVPVATQPSMAEMEPAPPIAATSIAQAVSPEELPAEVQDGFEQDDQVSPDRNLFPLLTLLVVTLGIAVIILSAVTLLVRRKI